MTGFDLLRHLQKLSPSELKYHVVLGVDGRWGPLMSLNVDVSLKTLDLVTDVLEGEELDF